MERDLFKSGNESADFSSLRDEFRESPKSDGFEENLRNRENEAAEFKSNLETLKEELTKIERDLGENSEDCAKILQRVEDLINDERIDTDNIKTEIRRLQYDVDELSTITHKLDQKNQEYFSLLDLGHSRGFLGEDTFGQEKNKAIEFDNLAQEKRKSINGYEEKIDGVLRFVRSLENFR